MLVPQPSGKEETRCEHCHKQLYKDFYLDSGSTPHLHFCSSQCVADYVRTVDGICPHAYSRLHTLFISS